MRSLIIFLWLPATVVIAVDMCPEGWTHEKFPKYGAGGRHGNYCYREGQGQSSRYSYSWYKGYQNYDAASKWCENDSGGTNAHIMTIHSEEENKVMGRTCTGYRCWIGFRDDKTSLLDVKKTNFYRASSNPSDDPTGWDDEQAATLVYGGNGPWWGADGSIGRGNDNFTTNIA